MTLFFTIIVSTAIKSKLVTIVVSYKKTYLSAHSNIKFMSFMCFHRLGESSPKKTLPESSKFVYRQNFLHELALAHLLL